MRHEIIDKLANDVLSWDVGATMSSWTTLGEPLFLKVGETGVESFQASEDLQVSLDTRKFARILQLTV